MTSHEQTTNDMTYFTDDLSSTTDSLALDLTKQTLIEECTLWKKQCNDLTMQKQAIEIRSDMLLAENRRLIEEKDNELKYLHEISIVKYEQVINELKDENIHLKLRIQELEDWNGGDSSKDHSDLQLNIDLLTSRNSQLESDLQRLQLQQRNNQLALERLDEYEETISQLQEELDQLRLNKKTPSEEKTLERQIIKLNEELQSLENANYQLQQQLQSKDRLFQTTPGSPPSINSSANLSSLYDQFITLLPNEFTSSDNTHLSLSDRFIELFEQFSTYIGTFSIIQEELDSLKQILNEKQDELEKLRSHFELTTDKLTQLQEEQSLNNKNKSYESDEDELEEILGFQQRAPSLNSLLSITPGEKQQLIAQNELLSSLLTDKEQELIELQQAEKTREDLMKTLDILRLNLQQMEFDKEIKQVELNDIRNILDEKLRENSSLKKEKMFFIEKLAQFERERQSTSDDIDLLRSILNEREIQLQKLIDQEKQWFSKQSELESSLKLFEENNSKLISNQNLFEQIQLDLKRIAHERDLAIVEKKQMEEKFLQFEERERKLMNEIEQLEKSLRNQLNINNDLNEQLVQYQDSLREQISIIARLTNENNELRQCFDDKDLLINNLQIEIDSKTKQIIEFDENFQVTNNSRVEKQLVKNILLSYFHTPINKQQEVVPLIGALLGFTQEEYQKAMDALANNYHNNTSGTSWLTGWLGATSSKPKTQSELSDKSFAELLIQYVDQQSIDNNLQQPMLTLTTDNSSESTSDNLTQSII